MDTIRALIARIEDDDLREELLRELERAALIGLGFRPKIGSRIRLTAPWQITHRRKFKVGLHELWHHVGRELQKYGFVGEDQDIDQKSYPVIFPQGAEIWIHATQKPNTNALLRKTKRELAAMLLQGFPEEENLVKIHVRLEQDSYTEEKKGHRQWERGFLVPKKEFEKMEYEILEPPNKNFAGIE